MNNKKPDDIKFLINTFSISVIIVAILVAFQPYLENEPRLEEVKQVERSLVTVKTEDLTRMVLSGGDKPVMFIGYASWCYYCRQVMPVVADMIRNHKLDNVKPVFVSLDEQPRKLSTYLVRNDYNKIFTPYVIDRGFLGGIKATMQSTGSSFTGTIPYIGFFDRDGKIRAESIGIVGERQILTMAEKANH